MKTKILGVVLLIVALLFAWRFLPILQVPDPNLSSMNSYQGCTVSSDCGRGGCNGEVCGRGGPATVCYPDPKLVEQRRGRQCSCLQNTCQWTKPLIGGL